MIIIFDDNITWQQQQGFEMLTVTIWFTNSGILKAEPHKFADIVKVDIIFKISIRNGL